MGNFKKFVPGRVDKEAQKKYGLTDTEMLIFKPFKKYGGGVEELTKEDIEAYLSLDKEELKKQGLNMKMIAVAEEAQRILRENKENLLNKIKEKEEKEIER